MFQGSGRAADVLGYAYNASSEEEVWGTGESGMREVKFVSAHYLSFYGDT